ncbi:hypothetical protein QVD17_00174 [Tagetes erecta]|uniref:Uncharacterized protein n=1 Tax=Tagetes erecta TaxID=13708 RepID=A0AAD8P5L8_TARER|nr:hypothetical protein QVD17_00174 [Tagetes erecta]
MWQWLEKRGGGKDILFVVVVDDGGGGLMAAVGENAIIATLATSAIIPTIATSATSPPSPHQPSSPPSQHPPSSQHPPLEGAMCSESYHASWLIQDGSNLPFRKIDFDPRIRVSDLLLCLCFRLLFLFQLKIFETVKNSFLSLIKNGFRFWCLIGPRTMKIEEYKRRGSSICRKSNKSKKAIITITVGTVFGFYVGVSFPPLPSKIHEMSSTCIKIQALASYRDYTYAAYGHDIGVLNRAHQVMP